MSNTPFAYFDDARNAVVLRRESGTEIAVMASTEAASLGEELLAASRGEETGYAEFLAQERGDDLQVTGPITVNSDAADEDDAPLDAETHLLAASEADTDAEMEAHLLAASEANAEQPGTEPQSTSGEPQVWIATVSGRIDGVFDSRDAASEHVEALDDDDAQRAEITAWPVEGGASTAAGERYFGVCARFIRTLPTGMGADAAIDGVYAELRDLDVDEVWSEGTAASQWMPEQQAQVDAPERTYLILAQFIERAADADTAVASIAGALAAASLDVDEVFLSAKYSA